MPIILDSNIRCRPARSDDPQHDVARKAVDFFLLQQEELLLTPQAQSTLAGRVGLVAVTPWLANTSRPRALLRCLTFLQESFQTVPDNHSSLSFGITESEYNRAK